MIMTDYFAKIVCIQHLSQNPGFVEKSPKTEINSTLLCSNFTTKAFHSVLRAEGRLETVSLPFWVGLRLPTYYLPQTPPGGSTLRSCCCCCCCLNHCCSTSVNFLLDMLSSITEMLSRICRRNFCTCSPRPWLFVGLGNPGEKYKGTRHNVGFEMLDAFAESQGIQMETVHCKAMFGKGFVNGIPVLLAKPLTYMNLSGESTAPLAAYYKLPLNRVVVFHDDMDLPCGVLRLHPKGGHHSHNGLKSVIYHFRANREFPRLRIGIGRPPGQMDPKAFMLQKFNSTARERIDAALLEGIHALKQVLSKGFSESSKCFNTEQKYKHIRLQTLPHSSS